MNMHMRVHLRFAACAALLVFAAPAVADDISWQQTLDLPIGLNLPQGVSGDILGITLGESYASAKAKIEALRDTAPNAEKNDKKLTEITSKVQFNTPGTPIELTYPGGLLLQINRYNPATPPKEDDTIEVTFSAPSSGNQVTKIRRTISYDRPEDQIRVSELVANLKAKFKSEPQVIEGGFIRYLFQFADGQPQAGSDSIVNPCLSDDNSDGTCDVSLLVVMHQGISPDHARMVEFHLTDNDRAKQNGDADMAFFQSYVRSFQQQVGGAAPKL